VQYAIREFDAIAHETLLLRAHTEQLRMMRPETFWLELPVVASDCAADCAAGGARPALLGNGYAIPRACLVSARQPECPPLYRGLEYLRLQVLNRYSAKRRKERYAVACLASQALERAAAKRRGESEHEALAFERSRR
jgi:hypothetical protein